MRTASWTLLGLVMIAGVGVPTASAATPLYFEKILIDGDANDFQHPALDLAAVYVSELYPYDPDQEVANDRVVVRIEPRDLTSMANCQAPAATLGYVPVCSMRLDVHFE